MACKRGFRDRVTVFFVACVTLALAVRLFLFINKYSVNILFSDQWDFWQGLFDGADLWKLWRWQHGPQRQGLGQWVVAATAYLSGWNVRAEVFVSAAIVTLAAITALALARALRGRYSYADIVIPLIILTLAQWEIFLVTPNPSHGPLPLLLMMLFGFAAQIQRPRIRVGSLAVIAGVATQTGFGLFVGVVALPVLVVSLVDAVRRKTDIATNAVGLTLVVASFVLLLHDYRFAPAAACFEFPDPEPARYLSFLSWLYLRSIELTGEGMQIYAGLLLPLGCAVAAVWGGWRMLASGGRERLPVVVFAFSGFSLAFAMNATIGRACLGRDAAQSSRYVPYLMPFLVAAYLIISTKLRPTRTTAAILLVLCVSFIAKECVWSADRSVGQGEYWSRRKEGWRKCYLAIENARVCSSMYSPVAADLEASHVVQKLRFLRQHHLNLFRETQ